MAAAFAVAASPGVPTASATVPTVPTALFSWGGNPDGQLGIGTLSPQQSTPVAAALPAGVSVLNVAAGSRHSLAVGSDHRLYAWGDNSYGQLGDGTTIQRLAPVLVGLPGGAWPVAVAAQERDSIVLGSDLKVYSWGYNADGEVGDGTTVERHAPVRVLGLPPVLSISGGQYHAVAVGIDLRLYAWGYNAYGQLGDGTTTNRWSAVPVALPAGLVVTGAAAGGLHSVVALSDHHLYTWGYNQWGELGDGTTTTRILPASINLPGGAWPLIVAAGYGHNLVLAADGHTYSWGYNAYGEVGNGTTIDQHVPVGVAFPARVVPLVLAGGEGHSLAVATDGSVWSWGYNGYGQLGDGTTTDHSTPAQVAMPGGAKSWRIAAGLYHSQAATVP